MNKSYFAFVYFTIAAYSLHASPKNKLLPAYDNEKKSAKIKLLIQQTKNEKMLKKIFPHDRTEVKQTTIKEQKYTKRITNMVIQDAINEHYNHR